MVVTSDSSPLEIHASWQTGIQTKFNTFRASASPKASVLHVGSGPINCLASTQGERNLNFIPVALLAHQHVKLLDKYNHFLSSSQVPCPPWPT
jgi:hypothetical protein